MNARLPITGLMLGLALFATAGAHANDFRAKGVVAKLGTAGMVVTPPRDWNRLSIKPGKAAETWTLDGEQLNDVTFYSGIPAGMPLVRERDRKRAPLPKFTASTLLVEIPELLENTYRAYKQMGDFKLTGSQPATFLDRSGVTFTYEYVDGDALPRKGEGHATLANGKLYMVTFDAPRLHFFEETLDDYRALVTATRLAKN